MHSVSHLEIKGSNQFIHELDIISSEISGASLIHCFEAGLKGLNSFYSCDIIISGVCFYQTLINYSLKGNKLYYQKVLIALRRSSFENFCRYNTEIIVLSSKNKKRLEAIYRQVKSLSSSVPAPMEDLYKRYFKVKFRFKKKDLLLNKLGVNDPRYFRILCLTHYLLMRESILPVFDKRKSLHIFGIKSTGKTSLLTKFQKTFGYEYFFFLEDYNLLDFSSYILSDRPLICVDEYLLKDDPISYLSNKEYSFLKKLFGCAPGTKVFVKHQKGFNLPVLPAVLLSNNGFIFANDSYITSRLHHVNFDKENIVVWSSISKSDFELLVYFAIIELLCLYRQKPLNKGELHPAVYNLHFGNYRAWLSNKNNFNPKYNKGFFKK